MLEPGFNDKHTREGERNDGAIVLSRFLYESDPNAYPYGQIAARQRPVSAAPGARRRDQSS